MWKVQLPLLEVEELEFSRKKIQSFSCLPAYKSIQILPQDRRIIFKQFDGWSFAQSERFDKEDIIQTLFRLRVYAPRTALLVNGCIVLGVMKDGDQFSVNFTKTGNFITLDYPNIFSKQPMVKKENIKGKNTHINKAPSQNWAWNENENFWESFWAVDIRIQENKFIVKDGSKESYEHQGTFENTQHWRLYIAVQTGINSWLKGQCIVDYQ